MGSYYRTNTSMRDPTQEPVLTRNDYTLSFHFLNFGPDPDLLPASSFAARWQGFLTPDCAVEAALFRLTARGTTAGAKMWIGGAVVLEWTQKDGYLVNKAVRLEFREPLAFKFEYWQDDQTAQHPAFALQWSLQGSSALADAVAAAASADVVVLVAGGDTSDTSGEGRDRSSLALPGNQLALIQAVRAATVRAKTPMALVVVQGKPFAEPWVKQHVPGQFGMPSVTPKQPAREVAKLRKRPPKSTLID